MRSESGAPAITGTAALTQSRDLTRVIVIAPLPSGPAAASLIVNSVPPVVMPHGEPSSDTSTV